MAAEVPQFIKQLGKVFQSLGRGLDNFGTVVQAKNGFTERLVPSTRVVPFKGKAVAHGYQSFVASSASVVGEVSMGEHSSVWYGATVKADRGKVTIGSNTTILDNALVTAAGKHEARLGSDVVVSPGAVIRGATVGDGSMIGMGAVLQPGATVGKDCFIDGGAVVPSGAVIPSGQLWTGSPARRLRDLSADELSYIRSTAIEYGKLSQDHYSQSLKPTEELEAEAELRLFKLEKGLKEGENFPQTRPDVIEYYKLTNPDVENHGLFRAEEHDNAEEERLREIEEVAADKIETDRHYAQARLERVGAALLQMSLARPGKGAVVVSDLEALDAEAAQMVREFVAQVAAAEASGDEGKKKELQEVLGSFDKAADRLEDEEVAAAAAEAYKSLVAHSRHFIAASSSSSASASA